MNLLINTTTTHKGGGVQVAKSFIEECRNFPGNNYHIIIGPSLKDKINYKCFPGNFHFYQINYRPATKIFSFERSDKELKEIEKKVKPDCVFTTGGPSYWRPEAPHLMGFNLPHYIYKDSPFFRSETFYKKNYWKLKGAVIRYHAARNCDAYVAQTEDVNQRLKKIFKTDKVFTVSNTYNGIYNDPAVFPDKLPGKEKGEFRFLYFSAFYRHKNFKIIPKVIDKLPAEYRNKIKFILTLEYDFYRTLMFDNYSDNIINLGPVKIEEGPSLYKECDAVFLPTLLECFSASYPEAMIMEKPILTSDLSFARSICGNAALYFNPVDPSDAAEKIIKIIDDIGLQKELIEKGKERVKVFPTPYERAKEYLRLCEELVNGRL